MDVQVAGKVFGKKPCRFEYEGGISGIVTCWKCQHGSGENCYPEDLGVTLPEYSAEDGIKAAWSIVELMKGRPNTSDSYGFSWPVELSYLDDRQVWSCIFHGKKSSVEGLAKNAPLAICRAALKACLV